MPILLGVCVSFVAHGEFQYNYTPRATDKRTLESVFKEARLQAGKLSRMMRMGLPLERQNNQVVEQYANYFLPQLLILGAFYLFSESLLEKQATVDARSRNLLSQVRNQLRQWFEELADVIPPERIEELRSRINQELERSKHQRAEYELGIDTLDRLVRKNPKSTIGVSESAISKPQVASKTKNTPAKQGTTSLANPLDSLNSLKNSGLPGMSNLPGVSNLPGIPTNALKKIQIPGG